MNDSSSKPPSPGTLGSGAPPPFSPLYLQVKALIMQNLQLGLWKPGEVIPSEIDLANRYKVSQGTMRKAIDELAAENLVVRRQGKGTFVATHNEEHAQIRFLRLMPDFGESQKHESQILEFNSLLAPNEIVQLLKLTSGDAVLQVIRVLSFSTIPVILEELWLPDEVFKGLTAEKLAEYHGPMYALFESEFGTRMIYANEKLKAVGADTRAATLLNVPQGMPLLSVERTSFTYGNRPVELRRAFYLTTHHHYQNNLN